MDASRGSVRCRTGVSIFSSAMCQTIYFFRQRESKCTGRSRVGTRKYGLWKGWCSWGFLLFVRQGRLSPQLSRSQESHQMSCQDSVVPAFYTWLSGSTCPRPFPYVVNPHRRLKHFRYLSLQQSNVLLEPSRPVLKPLTLALNFNCTSDTDDSEIIHNLIWSIHIILWRS